MLKYKGYLGKVEYDDEAKILAGEVLGIRDVITFQADAASKIEKAFRDSVDDYLAFCAERGEQPNKPMSGKLMLRIDPKVHSELAAIAEARNLSLNALIEDCLTSAAKKTG